jgi:hypothetical protein
MVMFRETSLPPCGDLRHDEKLLLSGETTNPNSPHYLPRQLRIDALADARIRMRRIARRSGRSRFVKGYVW